MFHSSTRFLICHGFLYSSDLRGNKSSGYHTASPHPEVYQHALHIPVSKHRRSSQSRSLRCNIFLPSTLVPDLIKLIKFRVSKCILTEKSLDIECMSLDIKCMFLKKKKKEGERTKQKQTENMNRENKTKQTTSCYHTFFQDFLMDSSVHYMLS